MPYSNEMYRNAEKIIKQRRDNAIMIAENRSEKIRKELPEINEIQIQLSNIGMEVSRLFFCKDDVQSKVKELKEKSTALIEKRSAILEKNGYNKNDMSPDFSCPVCEDRGFIGGRLCACHKELLKELMKKEVSTFAPLEKCTFDTFKTEYYSTAPLNNSVIPRERAEKIYDATMRYAQNFGKNSKNLIFLGATGLGKTHLSLAIANVVINRGFSVCYGTSQNICEDLRTEMLSFEAKPNYTKEKVLECDLLILDDLGTEIEGKYSVAVIYNIINTRVLSGKPTIISTNYEWDELLDKYDQRITSRLNGEYTVMQFFGKDIRNNK